MKKLLFLVVVLLAGVVATGLFVYASEGKVDPNAELESLSFKVQGMQSVMCEMAVKSTLKSLDGVDAVSVDRKAARAEVTFDPATVSPAAFVVAVNSLGYRASLPERADSLKPAGHPAAASKLTPDQIEIVTAFVASYILSTEEIPTGEDIVEATGVELSIADTPVLQRAVLTKLADDPRGQKLLAGSRCSDYGACSYWGNLAGASSDMLAMYEREKALDGKIFDDFAVPAFEARNLAGEVVRSSDLVGRPALIAFLAVHCNHSMDTFPILQELHRRYGEEGLQVVGVLVNSGSVEDANAWVPHFAPEYPVWVYNDSSLDDVYNDPSLGDLVGSHLVPTFLLVDERGIVRKQLVGFKSEETVLADLAIIRPARASREVTSP